jgi:dsDNA-specific endonuclease/ATPase MutS2
MDDIEQFKGDLTTWLARLTEMKPGDEVFVPATGRMGTLARLELHRQVAVVNTGSVQMEVPLVELMPDLGQQSVRQELARYRKKVEAQSRQLASQLAQAREKLESATKLQQRQKDRAKRFDRWLGLIARMKIGEDVPVNVKPGQAKLLKADLPGLRATVELPTGRVKQLSLQDLFPQEGPFTQGPRQNHPSEKSHTGPGKDKPIRRGLPHGKAAERKRRAVLGTKPGQKVFVVPFNTAATLVHIDQNKNQAVVLRGAMEIQVAIADLEPVGY